MKKRVYSGIRATGRLHLGNYLGAVKGMLALQDEYDCTYSVVDLHAMTTPYDPKELAKNVRNVILDYLAAGLDPKKCRLEIQSQIPQHTELSFLLATVYSLAPLEDLPTFKEKKAQYPKNVTTALVYYPILMAADVLLYKGELVPVGIDQEPHLEVMRECARKFNAIYGETFPEPVRFRTPGEYIPSLTGSGKMSKTVEGSFITLADDLATIKKKVSKIPTDEGIGTIQQLSDRKAYVPFARNGEVSNSDAYGVSTFLKFVEIFEGKERVEELERQYQSTGVKYGIEKTLLAEAIYKELQPFQEKRKYFEENPQMVDDIIAAGREQCLAIAQETMREVKEKMGLPL